MELSQADKQWHSLIETVKIEHSMGSNQNLYMMTYIKQLFAPKLVIWQSSQDRQVKKKEGRNETTNTKTNKQTNCFMP